MPADLALAVACALIGAMVTLPLLQALYRGRLSREASEVAGALADYAKSLRGAQSARPVDEALLARVQRLGIPEVVAFEFVQQLGRASPELLADAAQRLALRLKRRVAFERKMLARTAPGRRRGAVAAAAPGVAMLGLRLAGAALPWPAVVAIVMAEGFGCWLLWRVSRVEV